MGLEVVLSPQDRGSTPGHGAGPPALPPGAWLEETPCQACRTVPRTSLASGPSPAGRRVPDSDPLWPCAGRAPGHWRPVLWSTLPQAWAPALQTGWPSRGCHRLRSGGQGVGQAGLSRVTPAPGWSPRPHGLLPPWTSVSGSTHGAARGTGPHFSFVTSAKALFRNKATF